MLTSTVCNIAASVESSAHSGPIGTAAGSVDQRELVWTKVNSSSCNLYGRFAGTLAWAVLIVLLLLLDTAVLCTNTWLGWF